MAITPLPSLDRTAPTFRADVDTFFGTQLPTFSTQVEAARVEILAAESATGADADATAADRVQTGLDKTATAADRVQTGLDADATAADRVQTGLDADATAADRVQTGLDKTATAADRVQTGLDVAAAQAARNQAQIYATQQMTATSTTSHSLTAGPKTFAVETGKGFVANQYLVLTPTADPTKFAQASVNSYNATTGALDVTVDYTSTSGGPYTAWTLGVIGRMGASGQRQNVAISGDTTAIAGRNYFFESICTLTMPASPALNDTISFCNCTGAAGPMVDFGSQKVKGQVPGVVTLNGKNNTATVTATNSATTGWGEI